MLVTIRLTEPASPPRLAVLANLPLHPAQIFASPMTREPGANFPCKGTRAVARVFLRLRPVAEFMIVRTGLAAHLWKTTEHGNPIRSAEFAAAFGRSKG